MGLFSEMMEEASEQSSRIGQLEGRVHKLETDLAWERNENARLREALKVEQEAHAVSAQERNRFAFEA